nr:hypothetical protein Itr_chr10CG14290 [Ipomoea trifida]
MAASTSVIPPARAPPSLRPPSSSLFSLIGTHGRVGRWTFLLLGDGNWGTVAVMQQLPSILSRADRR